MRLDKYLKLSRLIKRRSVAKVLIEEGNILVNNKVSKPSNEIQIGDFISLKLGTKIINIKVTDLKEFMNKVDAKNCYQIIDESINYK